MDALTSSVPPLPHPRRTPRHVWAAPLFVLGVAVLAWVGLVRPFFNSPQRQPARDLAAARQLLEKPDGDETEAENLVRRALEHPEFLNGRVGEAQFLLGWAEARRAAVAPPELSGRLWADALSDLGEAEKQGVADEDQQRLAYQLGRAGFYANDDRRRVVDRLARSAEDADDKSEAFHLLEQAYLRLPEPDLEGALHANEMLRGVAMDDQLNDARLLGGELLLKLDRAADARAVLGRIVPPAPLPQLLKARMLRARSFQDEGKYAEAASIWSSALTEKKQTTPRGLLLYNLGFCYRQLDLPTEAAKVWEQCLAKGGDGDEIAASALALADVSVRENKIDRALELYARAVEKIAKPEDWKNSLLTRAKAIEVFEHGNLYLQQMGLYGEALKLVDGCEKLAGPEKASLARGQIWTQWAEAGELQMRQNTLAGQPGPTQETINARYCQAGAAYLLASSHAQQAGEKAARLWLGTLRYLSGNDRVQAASAFTQLIAVDPASAYLGEGWYRLGEAYRQAKDTASAEKSYIESMKFLTVYRYRARYRLAIYAWERGEVDDAEADLVQNLKLLRYDHDAESLEESLFAIGHLYFKRGNYTHAASHLEEALERFPENAEAIKARFELAMSYQQLADQKNFNVLLKTYSNGETIETFMQENGRLLRKAADELEKLIALVAKPEAATQLTREDIVRVPFRAADCRYYAGQYVESLHLYERIVEEYGQKRSRTAEEQKDYLLALGGTVRCMWVLIGSTEKYREKLRNRIFEMNLVLQEVDQATRDEWQAWLAEPKRLAESKNVTEEKTSAKPR